MGQITPLRRRSGRLVFLLVSGLLLVGPASADDKQRAMMTVVGATANADGRSQIDSQIIEECVQSLPTAAELQPVVNAKSEYLKMINGDVNDNRSVRTYSAEIDLTYVVFQRRLVTVTTSSIEKSEPVFKEVDGRFDQTKKFVSNAGNGDAYAGREYVHNYYFSNADAAIKDVKSRAEAWLKQKRATMCKPN